MQYLQALHSILFNALLLFLFILGSWGVVSAARNRSISGEFWGALFMLIGLGATILVIGGIMTLMGYRPDRLDVYFIYMGWLVVIMPSMYTQLRGRDDSSAALAFALLSIFNLFVGLSMLSRGLISPWLPVS